MPVCAIVLTSSRHAKEIPLYFDFTKDAHTAATLIRQGFPAPSKRCRRLGILMERLVSTFEQLSPVGSAAGALQPPSELLLQL